MIDLYTPDVPGHIWKKVENAYFFATARFFRYREVFRYRDPPTPPLCLLNVSFLIKLAEKYTKHVKKEKKHETNVKNEHYGSENGHEK